jgi:hypothetical protein
VVQGPRKKTDMKPRLEYWKVAPDGFKAMSSMEAYLRESGFDKSLLLRSRARPDGAEPGAADVA